MINCRVRIVADLELQTRHINCRVGQRLILLQHALIMAGSVLADAVWFHLRWNLICNFDCLLMDLEGFAVRYAFGMLLSLSKQLGL
ncbi:hypothetical protein Nepgr_009382 [Nepenthes gracilis]|uniref:Uncharacterized protein n=1 Tax=Nepenthes gracilis TaxID=150966 RepID=A0AAD3XK39_NEPGR|nr:hypothetical protein Nepgr_009382 [Nepenthes gracilis]